MGSPLSLTLIDIVMQDLEEKAINSMDIEFPFYYRYVVVLAPVDRAENILNTFNNMHNRLQFIIELKKNRALNFLDLSLI